MNERSAEQFALLVERRIALRGLTTMSLINNVPDQHEFRLVTSVKTDCGINILVEVIFHLADYKIYDYPLGIKLGLIQAGIPLIRQVEELWKDWMKQGHEEWVDQDEVLMFKKVGKESRPEYMNFHSFFMDHRLSVLYGELISASQTLQDSKARWYREAAVRLEGFIRDRQQHWQMVFSQLEPLSKRY